MDFKKLEGKKIRTVTLCDVCQNLAQVFFREGALVKEVDGNWIILEEPQGTGAEQMGIKFKSIVHLISIDKIAYIQMVDDLK